VRREAVAMSHMQSTEDLPSVVAADERSVRQQAIEQIQREMDRMKVNDQPG
jgi:hypothetical protein